MTTPTLAILRQGSTVCVSTLSAAKMHLCPSECLFGTPQPLASLPRRMPGWHPHPWQSVPEHALFGTSGNSAPENACVAPHLETLPLRMPVWHPLPPATLPLRMPVWHPRPLATENAYVAPPASGNTALRMPVWHPRPLATLPLRMPLWHPLPPAILPLRMPG